MTNHLLFTNLKIGNLTLHNRIIMAPLTRMRSTQPGDIPNQLNATYYTQRASAGLIISEATQISAQGKGYPATPGIYSSQQIEGWKLITNAVHKKDGKIFLQLWHVGRISHFSLQPNDQTPVAPSAIPAKNSGTYTAQFKPTPILTPRALELHEITSLIADYKQAAINAKEAGFDGVELHGANGYLLDQFLQDNSNIRTDNYGGSIINRSRLLLEVLDEIITVWGSDRVGVRLSPYGTFNDMSDSNPIALFSYVIEQLSAKNIAYLHLIEPRASTAGGSDANNNSAPNVANIFRKLCKMPVISAGGYSFELAKQALDNNLADAIAFGRLFISNPDLPRRFLENAALNDYDRKTFYGGNEKGYTDYPFLD
jgi:N-ethylmaleimide reductase